MTDVSISRLRVNARAKQINLASFLVEDACRTGLQDCNRLFVLRKLKLGLVSASSDQHGNARKVQSAYDIATQNAVHGSSTNAHMADCVWFSDAEEARIILLERLLSGKNVTGWYWRLAVPDWHDQKNEVWIGDLLVAALQTQSARSLVSILDCVLRNDSVDVLVEAIALEENQIDDMIPKWDSISQIFNQNGEQNSEPSNSKPTTEGQKKDELIVKKLRYLMPSSIRKTIETIAQRIGTGHRITPFLLEKMLLRASPPLFLSQSLLRDLTATYARFLQSTVRPERTEKISLLSTDHETPELGEGLQFNQSHRQLGRQNSEKIIAELEPENGGRQTEANRKGPRLETPAPPIAQIEQRSFSAGLWLCIPSLIHLGFRDWLKDRPQLLTNDAGRKLLAGIANHYHVPEKDYALCLLNMTEQEYDVPDWCNIWRIGLDRWLRRKVGFSLADLVWRIGWLRATDDQLTIRFPFDTGDIRLRRHALDVDPGWTDWLGFSVRYVYAQKPIL